MAHTHVCNLIHCIFSTKERCDTIADPPRLWQYIGGTARAKNILLLAAGGTSNHVHLLIALPPAVPLSKAMQELKGNTSKWMNEIAPPFAWQEGYGAFSVSQSQKQAVIDYIDGQTEHHAKRSFEEEFVALLKKFDVAYDPHYVFG